MQRSLYASRKGSNIMFAKRKKSITTKTFSVSCVYLVFQAEDEVQVARNCLQMAEAELA